MNSRSVLASADVPAQLSTIAFGLSAGVSWHEQRGDLDRQAARLTAWIVDAGGQVAPGGGRSRVGVNGSRAKGTAAAG